MVSNDETCLLVVEENANEYVRVIRSTILLDRYKKYSFLKCVAHPILGLRSIQTTFSAAEAYALADRDFRDLAKFAFSKCFRCGDVIVEQGSTCASIFYVVSGSVEVRVSLYGKQISRSKSIPVAQFEPKQKQDDIVKDQLQPVHAKSFSGLHSSFSHSNSFHHKVISDIVHDLDGEIRADVNVEHFIPEGSRASQPLSGSSRIEDPDALLYFKKCVEPNSTFFDTKSIPRPPILRNEISNSPRFGKFVQESAFERKCMKSFHLKTALAGNVIG